MMASRVWVVRRFGFLAFVPLDGKCGARHWTSSREPGSISDGLKRFGGPGEIRLATSSPNSSKISSRRHQLRKHSGDCLACRRTIPVAG
jgi:hypothetical protein